MVVLEVAVQVTEYIPDFKTVGLDEFVAIVIKSLLLELEKV